MNDIINSGMLNAVSIIVSIVVLIVGLMLWFFINRASSRANEQIELLEAILEQQQKQNVLLRRLCEANEPESEGPEMSGNKQHKDDEFVRLVAER